MSVSAQTFDYVRELVERRSAIQLPPGKEYLVENRLLPLARAAGMAGPNAVDHFVLRALGSEETKVQVVEALTTNETSWFRDGVPFMLLEDVILPECRRDRRGPLRVWSAACSTGQETYSIAMSLIDQGEEDFTVLGTDLSGAVLERARAGVYTQLEVNRGLPVSALVNHFDRAGTGWQVAADVRAHVGFRQHNLLDAPPAGPLFDVVFVRNVLIYFDAAARRDVLARIARVVRPGGFVILGAAETLPLDPPWERIDVPAGVLHRLAPERGRP